MNSSARTIKEKPDKNIKVGDDLLQLIDRAAKHCNTDGSYVCRAAARKLLNGRAKSVKSGDDFTVELVSGNPLRVEQRTIQKLYHQAGKRSLKIRNYVNPGVSASEYRAAIAAYCLAALAGPKYEAPEIPGEYEITENDEE